MVKNTYHNPQTYVSRVSIDHNGSGHACLLHQE